MPNRYFRDFVRGVFDGDGSVYLYTTSSNQHAQAYIVSGSKSFLEQIKKRLPTNINSNIQIKKGKALNSDQNKIFTSYRLVFSCINAYNFLEWIYYDDDLLSLDRKKDLAIKIKKLTKEKIRKNPHLYQSRKTK